MQVDFETIRYVTAIATQGRSDKVAQYVTAYRLLYSVNCVDYTVYNETSGVDKVHKFIIYIQLKIATCTCMIWAKDTSFS